MVNSDAKLSLHDHLDQRITLLSDRLTAFAIFFFISTMVLGISILAHRSRIDDIITVVEEVRGEVSRITALESKEQPPVQPAQPKKGIVR